MHIGAVSPQLLEAPGVAIASPDKAGKPGALVDKASAGPKLSDPPVQPLPVAPPAAPIEGAEAGRAEALLARLLARSERLLRRLDQVQQDEEASPAEGHGEHREIRRIARQLARIDRAVRRTVKEVAAELVAAYGQAAGNAEGASSESARGIRRAARRIGREFHEALHAALRHARHASPEGDREPIAVPVREAFRRFAADLRSLIATAGAPGSPDGAVAQQQDGTSTQVETQAEVPAPSTPDPAPSAPASPPAPSLDFSAIIQRLEALFESLVSRLDPPAAPPQAGGSGAAGSASLTLQVQFAVSIYASAALVASAGSTGSQVDTRS
jgi:hypothetical protein